MEKNNGEIHVAPEEVSGGRKSGVARRVLGIGVLIAVIALSLVWIIPALSQGEVEEEGTVSGKMDAIDSGDSTDSIVGVPDEDTTEVTAE